MTDFDVTQVEDDLDSIQRFMPSALRKLDLTYCGVPTLVQLEELLPYNNARIYVVDGRFPRVVGGEIERLAAEAFELIRSHKPGARICLFSSEGDLDKIAARLGVEYRRKGKYSCIQFAQELKRMLDG